MDIAEQLEICNEATPEPWLTQDESGYVWSKMTSSQDGEQFTDDPACYARYDFDRKFIIAARTNYPLALQTLLAIRTLCESESGELAGKVLGVIQQDQ